MKLEIHFLFEYLESREPVSVVSPASKLTKKTKKDQKTIENILKSFEHLVLLCKRVKK